MKKEYIICLDDEAIILHSIKQELRSDVFFAGVDIEIVDNGKNALELIADIKAEGHSLPVILSDQRMPLMTGDAFLLKAHALVPRSLKILLTGFADFDAVVKLVNHNVLYRYLNKPWNRHDLLLTLKEACRSFRKSQLIDLQAAKIKHLTMAMVTALESTNYFFDEDTGNHILRIAKLSAFIAEKAGLDEATVTQIRLYAPLHDIGKVGISRDILLKPASLTSSEFEQVKAHVTIGHRIISDEAIDQAAQNIVLYHHEKWNGQGYASGLKGEAIPLEARIVSIADVFDALVSQRIYKPPFTIQQAVEILLKERAVSFDPALIDAFVGNLPAAESYEELLRSLP